jgi:hypothetical protein
MFGEMCTRSCIEIILRNVEESGPKLKADYAT